MANYAAILGELAISGSRKADGTPNDSGTVNAYLPGGLVPVNIYADAAATVVATQPIALDTGGRIPIANYPDGLFIKQPVRLFIKDSSGATVSDNVYVPSTAGAVGINNAGWTSTTLDGVLTSIYTSVGGVDGKYQESGTATARTIKAKFAEIWISVMDFGAVGDGVTNDTTAIQNAINRAKALANGVTGLGSVAVWFPAGLYLIDQALTLSSARVSIRGESAGSTQITTSHASANVFTLSSCSSFSISGLRIRASSANSASAISMTDCSDVYISDITADSNAGALFMIPVVMTSGTFNSGVVFDRVSLQCQDNASARAVKLTNTSQVRIRDSLLAGQSGGAVVELAGTSGDIFIYANRFSGTATGILWTSGMTGTRFSIFGNPTLGTAGFSAPLDFSALASLPDYRQWGNNVEASALSAAVGNTLTPVLYTGNEIILSATSGGAGTITVGAPAILPVAAATSVDLYWDFVFKNASGGAVTWTLNAVFVTSAAIPTTDAHTIGVRFRWDRATSKLREVSRADTVT